MHVDFFLYKLWQNLYEFYSSVCKMSYSYGSTCKGRVMKNNTSVIHDFCVNKGPGWLNELGSWITQQLIQTYHQYGVGLRPALYITKRVHSTRSASDKVYQLLTHGRWFSPVSSTTQSGRHDIAKILLKVALNTINQIKSNHLC